MGKNTGKVREKWNHESVTRFVITSEKWQLMIQALVIS